jgi:hypothetical protein
VEFVVPPHFRENIPSERKEILLSPGEAIIFFTDGVGEAENENKVLPYTYHILP